MPVDVAENVERSYDALNVLVELGSRCTCDSTAVAECPNYVPGDDDESEVPEA